MSQLRKLIEARRQNRSWEGQPRDAQGQWTTGSDSTGRAIAQGGLKNLLRRTKIREALRSDRIFIHFENCQNLIKDLEQVTWDEGQIKKSENPLLTHLSDAFGYLIHYLHPFKPKIKAGMSKKRPVGLVA